MPAIGYTEELEQVRKTRVETALVSLTRDDDGPSSAADRLAAALDALAEGVVAEAALWEKYKKKGWQSTKTSLMSTSGKLRDLAKEVDAADAPAVPAGQRDPGRGIEPGGDPNQPGVAPRPDSIGYKPPMPDAESSAERAGDEWPREADGSPAPGTADDAAAELTTAERIAAGMPVVPTAETLAMFSDNGKSPLLDTAHAEARQMMADRNADPFSDPLPPGGALVNVEPITFAQLMTRAAAPADLRHWSYSQLSDMDECEVKYAARKIFEKPSLPQWALVGGRSLHAGIQRFELAMLQYGNPVADSAMANGAWHKAAWDEAFTHEISITVDETGIFPDDWRAANKGSENFDWWRVQGEEMLGLYVKQRLAGIEAATRAGVSPRKLFALTLANGQAPTPVLELELSIHVPGPMGNLEFKSILDQAWLCHDGTLLIVDIKSGRQMPSAFDTFQLGSQAIVLAQQIGLQAPAPFLKACYYDARKGVFTDPIVALERHSLEELVYRMHTAESRRQVGIYRPNVSTRTCTGCGVRSLCPMMGGK